MAKKTADFPTSTDDLLRELMAASGMTDYAIAKATGIDPTQIGRFKRGERSITTETADKLFRGLGYDRGRPMTVFILARINKSRGAIAYVAKLPDQIDSEWAYTHDPTKMIRVPSEVADKFKADMESANATFAVMDAYDFKTVHKSNEWDAWCRPA